MRTWADMNSKLFLLLAGAMALAACQKSNSPAAASGGPAGPGGASTQKAALTVEVIRPTSGDTAQVLDTAGGLYAWQEVAIGADVSGYRVSEVSVDVGDSVEKGQVLAKLDDVLLRQDVVQAQAVVEELKAALEQAQAAAKRGITLQQSGLISKQDLETLTTTAATATAKLNSATSQLQAANQKLEYATIRAPDRGVISERDVAPGQIASAGTTLFKLIRESRVEWRAEISANDIGRVHRGMQAAIVRADGTKATGVVRTVSPGLDPSSQRGVAYVDLKLEPMVRPGMYVTGSIQLAQAKTLTVPLSAVNVRDGFSYVFVVQPDNTVKQQRITVGKLVSDRLEVRDGITADDRLVASGAAFLRDGDTVQVANADAYPAAATDPKVAALPSASSAASQATK